MKTIRFLELIIELQNRLKQELDPEKRDIAEFDLPEIIEEALLYITANEIRNDR